MLHCLIAGLFLALAAELPANTATAPMTPVGIGDLPTAGPLKSTDSFIVCQQTPCPAGAQLTAATMSQVMGMMNVSIDPHGSVILGADLYPTFFGYPAMIVGGTSSAAGASNALVGETTNNLATPTAAFPVGTTGYGNLGSAAAGNVVFGLYGLGDMHSPNGTAIGGELTARNFSGAAPSSLLPPNTAFGTNQVNVVGENITCGVETGTQDCSIGINIANEAGDSSKPSFLTGIYLWNYRSYGLLIESQPSGNQTSAVLKNNGKGMNLMLETTGTMVPGNAVLDVTDAGGTSQFAVKQNGDTLISGTLYSTPKTWLNNQACTAGQISWDANYIYVCTATNTVKRTALSAF
jgi:hypothetical protein